MSTLYSLAKFLPSDSKFLLNNVSSVVDEATLKWNNKIFMQYNGIVGRNSYTDIKYYISVLDNYNILKNDVKFMQFLPIFISYDYFQNIIENEYILKNRNTLLFLKQHSNNLLPGFLTEMELTKVTNIYKKELCDLATTFEYGFYDSRFESTPKLEFLFPLFIRCEKIYIQTTCTKNVLNKKSFMGSEEFFTLLENIFEFDVSIISDDIVMINTKNMNKENFKTFLTLKNSIKEKIILDLLKEQMPDFNSYFDVLNYLKGVELIVN